GGAFIGGLVDARHAVSSRNLRGWRVLVVRKVETDVQDRRLARGGGQADAEPRRHGREVGLRRQPGHDRVPGGAAVGALVHLVAQERRVEDVGRDGVDLELGRALGNESGPQRRRTLQELPGHAAVLRLPHAVLRVDRGGGAVRATATAEDRGVEVIRVGGVDGEAGDRNALEEGTRDVLPRGAAVGGLQDAVPEVAVTGERALTGAVVDDEVVRRRHFQSAGGERGETVGPRHPRARPGVHRPDAPVGTAEDVAPVLADRQRADASVDRGKRAVAALDLVDRARSGGGPRPAERGVARRPPFVALLYAQGLVRTLRPVLTRFVEVELRVARRAVGDVVPLELDQSVVLTVVRDLRPGYQGRSVAYRGRNRDGSNGACARA